MGFFNPSDLVEAAAKKAADKFRSSHPHLEAIPGLLQRAAAKLKPALDAINKDDVKAMLSTLLGHRLNASQIDLIVQAGDLLLQAVHIIAVEFKLFGEPEAEAATAPEPAKKASKAAVKAEAPKQEAEATKQEV